MKEYAVRLKKGDDLKKSIEDICKQNRFNTAVVLSSVGCLYELNIRLAKAIDTLHLEEDFEIINLNGTVSSGKAHLHISVSDDKGNVFGGHLKEGCFINTTCELVLGVLEDYSSKREYDDMTGYDEIEFRSVKND